MASVQVLPLATYPSGPRSFGPIDIANDVTSIDFTIACRTTADPTIWPNITTVLTITPWVSVDGGLTWVEAGKSVTPGGIHIGKNGTELSSVASGGFIPPVVNGITRKFKLDLDIVGPPLRSSATVEVN